MTHENKIFYQKTARLVIPMALQNLINVGISSIDVIMLGRVGEKVLSGASLGSQIAFIMSLFIFGVTSGALVLLSQYWGKRDMKSIETVFAIAVKIALVVGAVFTLAAMAIPEVLMSIFTNDSEVIGYGTTYLRIVALSYIVDCIGMVYLNCIRSMEKVMIATFVYLCSMITNIVVNAVLIYGLFGAPKLGVAGAAIGTVVARVLELIIIIIYDRKFNDVFKFKFSSLTVKNPLLVKDYIKISSPVIANELMWGLGMSAITAVMGHLGSAVTAANSVAQVGRNLATVVSFGMAAAASVMVGNAIGEGKMELAKDYARKLIGVTVIAGLFGCGVILVARPFIVSAMTLTDTARRYLSVLLLIISYYVVAQSYNSTMVVGIFRGGGDTKFGFFLDVVFMWTVAIPAGAIAAFVLGAPVEVVMFLLFSDEILKVPITTLRYRSYKWLKNVTR